MTTVDVLVFGPHPDDIEIGLGATIAAHTGRGDQVGLCDLTRGELGSNGTVAVRMREAREAAEVLGVAWRENLGWPDGGIGGADQVRAAAEFIRRTRPAVVGLPYWRDRHPDHVAAFAVLNEAVFRAGLRRYAAAGEPWRPEWTCHYFINDVDAPSFVIDVTGSYDRKRDALACHRSQFDPAGGDVVETRLTGRRFLQMIEARDAHLGSLIGAGQAEGVIVKEPVVRSSLLRS